MTLNLIQDPTLLSETSPRFKDKSLSASDFQKCIKVMTKPIQRRKPEHTQHLLYCLLKLNIFCRPLISSALNKKTLIERIIPYLKLESYSAGTPIIHHNQSANKLYIICSGRVKEYIPKDKYQIQKEARNYKPVPANNTLQTIGTLDEIPELEHSKTTAFEPSSPKRLFGLLTLPIKGDEDKLKRDTPGTLTNLNQRRARRALVPACSLKDIPKDSKLGRESEVPFDNAELDENTLLVFRNNPDQYFAGDIPKVKFSRFCSLGDHFGLTSFQGGKHRPSTILAAEDSFCITLLQENLNKAIEEEEALYGNKAEFFSSIFTEMSKASLLGFAVLWEEENYEMKDNIFRQGDPSQDIYVLISGEITLSKSATNPSKDRPYLESLSPTKSGRKDYIEIGAMIAKICEGNFFGEEEFFKGTNRAMTATVCSAKAKVLRLSAEHYSTVFESYGELILQIKDKMISKVYSNKERLRSLYLQNNPTVKTLAKTYSELQEKVKKIQAPTSIGFLQDNHSPKLNLYGKKDRLTPQQSQKVIMANLKEEYPNLIKFVNGDYPKNRKKETKPQESLLNIGESPRSLERAKIEELNKQSHSATFTKLKSRVNVSQRIRSERNLTQSGSGQRKLEFKRIESTLAISSFDSDYGNITKDMYKSWKTNIHPANIQMDQTPTDNSLNRSSLLNGNFVNRSMEIRKFVKKMEQEQNPTSILIPERKLLISTSRTEAGEDFEKKIARQQKTFLKKIGNTPQPGSRTSRLDESSPSLVDCLSPKRNSKLVGNSSMLLFGSIANKTSIIQKKPNLQLRQDYSPKISEAVNKVY